MKYIFYNEGSVSALVALLVAVMAGFTALVTDAGILYINKAQMNNAMDSAVLAGVQKLPLDPQAALETAENYAQMNGVTPGTYTFQIDVENRSITGSAKRQVGFFFARAIGIPSGDIVVHAKARIAPISSTGGVVPFGVLEGDFTFGQEIVLKEGAGDTSYSGWFGALRLGGNGSHVYRDNIKYGYPDEISVGDIIPIEAGNMSGPTRAGVEHRLNECSHIPHCSIYSYVEGCPRIFIVPIVSIEEINDGGHPAAVRVLAFAAFLVEEYSGNGQESYVRGCFIRYAIPGRSDGSGQDYGLYGAQLCE